MFCGSQVMSHRGLLSLQYPVQHGIVSNYADLTSVWGNVFAEMGVNPEEVRCAAGGRPSPPPSQHPVLLTEAALCPAEQRLKLAEILFEQFNVPAVCVAIQAVLSLCVVRRRGCI